MDASNKNLPDEKTVFSGWSNFRMLREDTDLPLPDSPTMASVFPAYTQNELSFTAGRISNPWRNPILK
jgi:hypothetical protein